MEESLCVAPEAWESYDALRDLYWHLAGVEGVGLQAFVVGALADAGTRERVDMLGRLVEDVEDTALQNIALKAGEEGGVFEELADERIEEVREERARLLARLERARGAGG